MFPKLPTHLRPFFGRIPSASPDLFTPNPSLLHHLPQNGSSSHGLVTQAQSSAQAAGGAGSTGRAGYQGGSAGSGSGYTGHARVFTSIHQSSADPSTVRDDENKGRRKRRESISFRPPYHRPITVIEEPVSLASRLRLIGPGLRAVEVPESQDLRLEDVRQSTLGPSSRPTTPRSRSTLDLYQVGIAPGRQIRAYSTAPERKLSQPNRVLMDLAGLDIPTKRTYSSAVATDENVDYPTTEGDETDRRFYTAIHHATQDGRRDFCNSLVAHYRSPRDGPSPHAELESHLPRPEGYSVGTYNACLNALLSVRRHGESIAPILEMYNEMLEREIMPNGRTYVSVIKALCHREKDVQSAVKQDTEQRKWANYKSTQLGLPRPKNGSKDVIKGYLSEGNFDSAYNLFTGIKNVQTAAAPNGFYRFHPQVYSYLLDALATRERPSREVVPIAMDIFEHAVETDTASHRLLYKHLFRLLGKTKDVDYINALWTRFETEHAEGKGRKMREWKDVLPGTEIDEREVQVEGFQREVWNSAIKAFVQVGLVDKGLALLDQMLAREGKVSLDKAPRPKEDTLGVAIALAERGEYERSKAIIENAPVGLRPMDLGMYLDALCAGGQWRTALDVYLPILANAPEDIRPDVHRIKRIYTTILGSSRESLEPLSHVPTLMSTGTYMIDPDLATAHIKLLLQHGHLDAIAPVLNGFGPMKVRMEQSVRAPMLTLLGEIVGSPIEFKEMLEVLHGFSRQQIYPVAAQQKVIAGIIDKYMASSSRDSIDQQGWTTLSWVFSRTTSPALEQGEYDAALEAFISDITAHAPETLKLDTEGRVIRLIAEKLFNRFGSDRATSMLTPLLGEEQTLKTLEEFYQVSEPELVYDSASSSSDAAPSTPPAPAAQAPRRLVIDDALSRRIDTHQQRPDGNFQITPQKAYNELRSAVSSNRIPHPDSLVRLLLTLSREGDEPRALELYSLGQNLIQSTPNPKAQSTWWRQFEDAMIIAQCHLSHLEQAGLHRHRLVERGMAPSADAYATMIASSKDTTDDAQVARELWTESQSLGVRPHLYLYNTVISKLSKARKADTALEMFGQMKERGVRPSSVTYGAVINACCRVGDAESAETLFNEMSSQPNFRPRVPPFNTMMQFYLQTRPSRERVLHYYNALLQSGVRPSAHTYKLLLDAYHTLAPLDLTLMERTFAELCADTQVKVQGTHWASLITAYGISNNDVEKALEVFEVIPTHPSNRGGRPLDEPVVWEAILNVLATKGTVEQMETMRTRMESSGAKPTAYVYNVLISGYSRHSQIEKSREIFESMVNTITGVSAPNNHPQLHTSSGHPKPHSDVNQGAVFREPSTYEVMIRAELESGDRERAEEVVRRMEERGYPAAVFFKARSLLENNFIGNGHGQGRMEGYHHIPTLGLDAQVSV